MDNEDVDVKNVIGEYPPTFPYLVLLLDGIVVHYRNDEFLDFMILGKYKHNAKSPRSFAEETIFSFLQILFDEIYPMIYSTL